MNDFFAALYELITSQGTELSKLLYDGNSYASVGLLMWFFSALWVVLYYYAFNHPKYNRWIHWLIAVAIACIIDFLIAYFVADGIVYDTIGSVDGYILQMIIFAIANIIWTFVFSFAFSMCIKWKSTNAKHSPF